MIFSNSLKQKIKVFNQNKRAKYALLMFAFIFVLSLFSELIANDKPLILKYKNNFYFPVFQTLTDRFFGGDFETPADYKDPLIKENIEKNGFMVMPFIPFSYNTVDYNLRFQTPSKPDKTHFLGTDDEGRDIVARLLYGIRLSIVFAFVLTFISSAIGILIGAIQGYFGGKVDLILQRIIEIWESLPQLFILIIVASIFMPTFWSLLFILMFFSWTSLTNMVRAEFLRTRNFEYVMAAKALGVSNIRIILKHILPNALITSLTFIPFILSESIVALTSLDFLGLGLSQDYPSLGDLVRQGKDNLQAPWIGITIFVVLASLLTMLIFIGEGVRDAFDTRKQVK